MALADGAGRNRRDRQGRGLPPRLERCRSCRARPVCRLGRGGGMHGHRRSHGQYVRPAIGARRFTGPGDGGQSLGQPTDRRQIRRRVWRAGGARSGARAQRCRGRDPAADRDRFVDQRGRLAFRAGDDGVGGVRRSARSRQKPSPRPSRTAPRPSPANSSVSVMPVPPRSAAGQFTRISRPTSNRDRFSRPRTR